MSGRIEQTVGDARAQAAGDQSREPVVEQLRLDDPVAAQTEWVPVCQGGANFCTHKLVQVSPGRVEFRPTAQGPLIPVLFLLSGLGALAFGVYGLVNDVGAGPFIAIPLVVGCAFAALGGALFWFMTRRAAFDQQAGCFWKGGSTPVRYSVADAEYGKNAVPLAQIHAVQLIPKLIEDEDYYSYELNLVVKDGSRVNVVDHGDLARIRQDARQLAQFLNVPIWDAT